MKTFKRFLPDLLVALVLPSSRLPISSRQTPKDASFIVTTPPQDAEPEWS